MLDKNNEIFKKILGENALPSEQQLKICDFVSHGIGNGCVEARAGCGKSKTIELCANFIPQNKKVLIVAFNKNIADHLKEKLANNTNVDVMTYHSLGYSILKTRYNNLNLDDDKYKKYILSNIEEINPDFPPLKGPQKARYIANIQKLFNYTRYNLCQSKKEIEKLVTKYGVTVFSNEVDAVIHLIKWGSKNVSTVDFQDMIWLPYELGITGGIYRFSYDFIFVDEAQDSSLAQQNLVKICEKRNTRYLIVGDTSQCINSWAGSDFKSFETFKKKLKTKQFDLNVSYRCPKSVGILAQKYVHNFLTLDTAINGTVQYNVPISAIKEGDMVLCRLTSPLVRLYLDLIDKGRKVYVKGLGIGQQMIDFLKNFNEQDLNKIREGLYNNIISVWEGFADLYGCDLKSAANNPEIMLLYDDILIFDALTKDITTVDELYDKINRLFINQKEVSTEDKNVIHLSTVHKAKGLENDNVFILCPSMMPSKLASLDWEKASEENLIYVAYTRAKKTLNFISEKDFPPDKSYSGTDALYSELKKIKKIIESSSE